MFLAAKNGETLYSQPKHTHARAHTHTHTHTHTKRSGVDCGSDHELLSAKFRFTLRKVEKTTRRLRYDLNQIPYEYTVEVTNRFKGLDL